MAVINKNKLKGIYSRKNHRRSEQQWARGILNLGLFPQARPPQLSGAVLWKGSSPELRRSIVWPWTGICRKISVPKVLLLFEMRMSSALWIKPCAQDVAEKDGNLLLASQLPEAAISGGAEKIPATDLKGRRGELGKPKRTLKSSHKFLRAQKAICTPRKEVPVSHLWLEAPR